MVSKPTLSLAEMRERQRREQAALAALELSGRADEAPNDLRKLAVIVHDLTEALAATAAGLDQKVRRK